MLLNQSTLTVFIFNLYHRYIDKLQLVTIIHTMSMGAFDEDEYERREAKNGVVDADFDDERVEYRGTLTYDSGDSTEGLLDQFKQIKSK